MTENEEEERLMPTPEKDFRALFKGIFNYLYILSFFSDKICKKKILLLSLQNYDNTFIDDRK